MTRDTQTPSSTTPPPNRRALIAWIAVGLFTLVLILRELTKNSPPKSVSSSPSQEITANPSALTSTNSPTPTLDLANSPPPATRTTLNPEQDPSTPKSLPTMGRIDGQVKADLSSPLRITDGFAHIQSAPIPPGFPLDPAEAARLYVALPVTRIGADGRFTFPRVPLGDWIVRVDPDQFEPRVQQVTLSDTSPSAHLEFTTQRLRSTKLYIALVDETGAPLFSTARGADLQTALAMRLALLPVCPRIGDSIDPTTLKNSPTIQALEPTDPCATIDLTASSTGCACALLGDLVMSGSPYVGDQGRVELQVTRSEFASLRRTLDVQVIDAQTRLGVAGATVEFKPARGFKVLAKTTSDGWARGEDVHIGRVEISVEHESYLSDRGRTIACTKGSPALTTVELVRGVSLSGRFIAPDGRSARFPLAYERLGSDQRAPAAPDRFWKPLPASSADGRFSLTRLEPGEYLVGHAAVEAHPPESVRAGSVTGWTYVDARLGDVTGIEIVLTREFLALYDRIGGVIDEDRIHELMRERGGGSK